MSHGINIHGIVLVAQLYSDLIIQMINSMNPHCVSEVRDHYLR